MSELDQRMREIQKAELKAGMEQIVQKYRKPEDTNASDLAPVPEETSGTKSSEYTPEEQKAIAKGWKPEYQGEDRVDAKTFLDRSPFFERINSQKKEIQQQKEALQALTEHFQQKTRDEVNSALAQKEAERLALIKEGNVEATRAKETEMRRLHEEAQKTANLTRQKPPQAPASKEEVLAQKPKEVQDFYNKYKNDWFNDRTPENLEMSDAASTVNDLLVRSYQRRGVIVDMPTHLKNVEEALKKQYPHRFKNQSQDLPPAVGRSTASGSSTPSGNSLIAQLTPFQLQVARKVEAASRGRDGKIRMTVEDYAKKLQKEGKLGKRN